MKSIVLVVLLAFLGCSHGALDMAKLPQNIVVYAGGTAVLRCAVANPGQSHSMQWVEFVSNVLGAPISDNGVIGNHPEADRMAILQAVTGEYFLQISNVKLSDGGGYLCRDAQATVVEKHRHGASLTVMEGPTNCTTTIGESGVVLDTTYHTNDCIRHCRGALQPNMTWTGFGQFEQRYSAIDELLWSGMHYNVTRDMDTRAHQCTTHFTGYFLPVDGDTADNVPTFTEVHQSRQMFVYWGPNNLAVSNQREHYQVGDALVCSADAWPPATHIWQNMRNNQIISGSILIIPADWVGHNQSLRCEARNVIEGTNYANNIFVPINVPIPTTTPTPTTPSTTTPPPAVSDCPDITGSWSSVNPTRGSLCINIEKEYAGGLTGLLKNATDTYWVDIVGRSQVNKYDQHGFNGIWPGTIGVSSFVGECHRCFGVEQLLINVVTRRKGSPCGVEGETQYTTQYQFYRDNGLNCPILPRANF